MPWFGGYPNPVYGMYGDPFAPYGYNTAAYWDWSVTELFGPGGPYSDRPPGLTRIPAIELLNLILNRWGRGPGQAPTNLWSALADAGILIDQPPPELASDLERIWNLTRDLRELLDLLLMHRLVRSYWDPARGEWVTPDYSVTVYTTMPEETTTPPPEGRTEPTEPTGPSFPIWIFNPVTGVWEPQPPIVFTTTVYTSVVEETTEEPPPPPPPPFEPRPTPPVFVSPPGWRFDPSTGVWIPDPPIIFTTTVYTTAVGETITEEPPQQPPPFQPGPIPSLPSPLPGLPPLPLPEGWEPTRPPGEESPPSSREEPPPSGGTPVPSTSLPQPSTGGGGTAPLPGPAAPVIGSPLGESVWRLAEYVPVFTPPIGYYLAGR